MWDLRTSSLYPWQTGRWHSSTPRLARTFRTQCMLVVYRRTWETISRAVCYGDKYLKPLSLQRDLCLTLDRL